MSNINNDDKIDHIDIELFKNKIAYFQLNNLKEYINIYNKLLNN